MQHYALATESDIQLVCDIMELRIRKNFSAILLSKIIGRPLNYVAQVEAFQKQCYPSFEIRKIVSVLDGKDSSFWPRTKCSGEVISICIKKTRAKGYFTYSCKTYKWKSRIIFINIQEPENIRTTIFFDHISDVDLTIGMDMLRVMVRDGYMDRPRLPIDVYAHMNKFLRLEVDPGYVLFLLEIYAGDFLRWKLKTLMINGCQNYVRDHML